MNFFTILFLLIPKNSLSNEIINFNQLNFFKTGEYFYEFGLLKLDVYKIYFYCQSPNCTEDDIKNGRGSLILKFKYLRDVKRKYSQKGWDVGLKRNLGTKIRGYKSELDWLKDNTFNIKKDDVIIFYVDNNKLNIYKNNEIFAKTINDKLTNIVFLPWIGKKPITKKCKENLFKNILTEN